MGCRPQSTDLSPPSARLVLRANAECGMTRIRGDLHVTQPFPAPVLFSFLRTRILETLEPKFEPIQISLVDLVTVLRLVFVVQLVGIDEHLDGSLAPPQSSNQLHVSDVFRVSRVDQQWRDYPQSVE